MAKFKAYSLEQGELIPRHLSDWIPENHLARLISDIVEQLDLRKITDSYSHRGEEAYHPVMLLKLWIYGYATGVFTSRKIRQAIEENIPFRWLCGGNRPDFRTIGDFRKNNIAIIPELFKQVVQIAMDIGYVSLGHVSIDGSKLKADAAKHKAMSRERMKEEIKRLEKEIKEALEKTEAEEKEDQLSFLGETVQKEQWDRQARIEKIKESLRQLEQRKPESESKTAGKDQINFTDPESRIMDTKTQGVIQGYNGQIAVDAKNHIIVGTQISNNSSDQKQFGEVLNSIEENTGKKPEKVSADAGYFSTNNIKAAEKAQIDAYIAGSKEGKRTGNPYDKTNFTYDPQIDSYICPAGKIMRLKYTRYANAPEKDTQWIYETGECQGCPNQKDCVKSKSGKRMITRTESDPIREAMRTKVQSDHGKAVYKQRKAIVEPVWGVMKEVQGFRQFNLRGEDKVNGEFILLALSYNLRKFHSVKYPKPSTLYKRERSAQKQKRAA